MIDKAFVILLCVASLQGFLRYDFKTAYDYISEEMLKRTSLRTYNSEENFIYQPLDHFNANNPQKLQMTYFTDNSFWQANGPIIIVIGGEGTANGAFGGIIYEIAQATGSLLVKTEHRYYGNSQPNLDLSNSKNYQYLSSRQALADIAYLIQSLKQNPQAENSKVIVAGGSYPGNLAAWMKLTYPDLIVGALSSSAPVLAEKDFSQYLEKVGEDFRIFGTPGCYDKIVQMFQHYDELYKNQPENKKHRFFYNQILSFSFHAQSGEIQELCNEIQHTGRHPHLMPISTYSSKDSKDLLESPFDNNKAWTYQLCTEFGYFTTTNSSRHPFTNNLPYSFFVNCCTQTFGPEYNEQKIDAGIAETNARYGGKTPNVTNVIFVNNGADPWSTLGVTEPYSDSNAVIVVPNSFHCNDLWSRNPGKDSKAMAEAKDFVFKTVVSWLQ